MSVSLRNKLADFIIELPPILDDKQCLEYADQILVFIGKYMPAQSSAKELQKEHTHGLGVCWCGYCGDHISLAGTGNCYQCGKPMRLCMLRNKIMRESSQVKEMWESSLIKDCKGDKPIIYTPDKSIKLKIWENKK